MTITKEEKKVLWNILFSVRNCFNDDGILEDEYYKNVLLVDMTKEQKQLFDNLLKKL